MYAEFQFSTKKTDETFIIFYAGETNLSDQRESLICIFFAKVVLAYRKGPKDDKIPWQSNRKCDFR